MVYGLSCFGYSKCLWLTWLFYLHRYQLWWGNRYCGKRVKQRELSTLSKIRHSTPSASSNPILTHRLHHIGLAGNTVKALIGSLFHLILCEEALAAGMHPPGERKTKVSAGKAS